ncbi:MAG: Hpt domain-containing protein [Verrucomicrobiota bacterium]
MPSIIDPQAIENLRELGGGDDSFLREILGIYLQDTPLRLAELHAALASGDQGGFARAAHTIKGSSSNIGAEEVRLLSESLEQQAKHTAPGPALAPAVAELETAFARVKTELDKLIA